MSIYTLRFAVVAILGMSVMISGCGKRTNDVALPPETDTKSAMDTPAPVAPTVEKTATTPPPTVAPEIQAVLDAVEGATNFVALDNVSQQYNDGADKSELIDSALTAHWESLIAGVKPMVLVDGLEYLGAYSQATGPKEFTLSLLFRPTVDLSTDYHLIAEGQVFPANIPLLPTVNQEKGWVKIHRRLHDDPTSNWKQGEFHVVHLKEAAPLIPYNFVLRVYNPTEDNFWNRVGNQLALGWQWAALDEADFLKKIEACTTPAALYAIAPPGPTLTAALETALKAKWVALTQGMTPQTMVDGLDFLHVDTKATGKKQYTFSFLLKPTRDLDTDYHLTIVSTIDPSHVDNAKAENTSEEDNTTQHWFLSLYGDPTSKWRAGDYHVAQFVADTEIIPYNLSIRLQLRDEKRDYLGGAGELIDLGWQADIAK